MQRQFRRLDDYTYPDAREELNNSLDLGVIIEVGRRVGVDTAESTIRKALINIRRLATHPMALTVLLWPEYRAEAELALSVMKLSIECV